MPDRNHPGKPLRNGVTQPNVDANGHPSELPVSPGYHVELVRANGLDSAGQYMCFCRTSEILTTRPTARAFCQEVDLIDPSLPHAVSGCLSLKIRIEVSVSDLGGCLVQLEVHNGFQFC